MTDERSPDLTQALLLELRAQLEEARQASEYLHVRWTETAARADALEGQLADARLAAEQGVKVAEALATEKAALLSRVGVLEAALRGLRSDLDRVLAMRSTLGRTEWLTIIADKARAALEVEP